MTQRGDWERRFGAARRKTDRRLLEELERQIAEEDHRLFVETDKRFAREWAGEAEREAGERRYRLSRAFGRPTE